uniref:Secreted protein n=1 Tax=Steinernema glaseri TaxID=37863 RepID=A0A1I7YIA4_9BILA
MNALSVAIFFVSVALLEACGSDSLGTTNPLFGPTTTMDPRKTTQALKLGVRSASFSLVSVSTSLHECDKDGAEALEKKIQEAIVPIEIFETSRRISRGKVELLLTVGAQSCSHVEHSFQNPEVSELEEVEMVSVHCI